MSKHVREDPDDVGYELIEECSDCDGKGMWWEPGRMLVICPSCEGSGNVPHVCG